MQNAAMNFEVFLSSVQGELRMKSAYLSKMIFLGINEWFHLRAELNSLNIAHIYI